MDTSAAIPRRDTPQLKRAGLIALALVAVLWLIKLVEDLGRLDFSDFGVYPHEWFGLPGVLTAPLIHGSFEHLIMNSLPLAVLLTLALFNYPRGSVRALALIWIAGGLGIWLIGRPSWHIGASGVTHGLMFYLFLLGLLRRDRNATVIAMIVFFLYGGMVMTVLPREIGVSWEAHLCGALAGAVAAFLWQKLDPPAALPKPSWELEEEAAAAAAAAEAETFEMPRPNQVPILWHRMPEERGTILEFPRRRREEEPPTLH
ncbi:membrane associated rhomboid family serine protease [Tahibacter aquaticus]|uniref:Membrane associated rhomboid family serine protease n=1 Tax=Tahibacter aquaticus TaxID=520092 RepID=A0A4R6Z7I6_9GAMM|nr:rhomboid family intramembrane serine protease [Tahibacter aquaticus]TDR47549.1 membrane associated rhomboid family serine protease [Tahibacter aquaticus]